MTRSTEQSLEEMTRSLKKISDSLDNMGRVLARYFHPSRKPDRSEVADVAPLCKGIPVEIDWENPSLRGTAFIMQTKYRSTKSQSTSTKIIIEFDEEDEERASKLIREGFIETLGISTFRK